MYVSLKNVFQMPEWRPFAAVRILISIAAIYIYAIGEPKLQVCEVCVVCSATDLFVYKYTIIAI